MTDYLDDDSKGIKSLRKQYEKLGTENKELRSMVEQLMADRNATGVADTLASSGLDPRVAKFYPKDAKTDAESVNQWVEENKDLFGNRRIVDDGHVDSSTLTDAERRGYQVFQDMAAYETGLQVDLKSQLDKIEYDRQNPEAAQQAVLDKLKEFGSMINR